MHRRDLACGGEPDQGWLRDLLVGESAVYCMDDVAVREREAERGGAKAHHAGATALRSHDAGS
eukprot:7432292-Heterocapsa_arctica.AAC.1